MIVVLWCLYEVGGEIGCLVVLLSGSVVGDQDPSGGDGNNVLLDIIKKEIGNYITNTDNASSRLRESKAGGIWRGSRAIRAPIGRTTPPPAVCDQAPPAANKGRLCAA